MVLPSEGLYTFLEWVILSSSSFHLENESTLAESKVVEFAHAAGLHTNLLTYQAECNLLAA